MDAVDSVQKLCHRLISSAFQRCRVSEQLCRLSVALNGSRLRDPAVTLISISDTGVACSLGEFQDLKLQGGLSEKLGICDEEISNHQLNLMEGNSAHRLNRLPSISKNGMRFSGTDVCLTVVEKSEVIVDEISRFFQKMLILNIPSIGFELLVHHEDASGPHYERVFLPNEWNALPFSASNLERLKCGFEDYLLKQRNCVTGNCDSRSTTLEHLKSGTGTEDSSESSKISGLVMEAVITISEFSDQMSPYLMECGPRTEVLYFKDFSPSPVSKSSLSGLLKIDWKSYGLKLGGIVDQDSELCS
ncbi:hypothetical protein CRG98_016859 [Punica granatum]|uniref:Uncharacterized protein n=1 Tax=Punica granatum TaxID=22663 RepID=A0A2I0K3Q4_PUNGR|nr:hypothetical protein CRG98_016859 [Punica granatum]